MGWLRDERSGVRVPLEASHLVGRTARCALMISDARVSHEHASLRWDGEAWTIRDLGSLNRTLVNGQPIAAGQVIPLVRGASIAFGTPDVTWCLDDAAPPCVMAVPLKGGIAVVEQDGLLALPSAEHPLLTIFRDAGGSWAGEDQSTFAELQDQAIFQVGNVSYRFCLPQPASRTRPVEGLHGCRVSDLQLEFLVSQDLEHIEVVVRSGHLERKLAARSHNELLLILARRRQEDARKGLPLPNCGWVQQDELAKMVHLDLDHLNVQIFRIRRQFGELGILDPGQIVERRQRLRHMRLGAHHVAESSL